MSFSSKARSCASMLRRWVGLLKVGIRIGTSAQFIGICNKSTPRKTSLAPSHPAPPESSKTEPHDATHVLDETVRQDPRWFVRAQRTTIGGAAVKLQLRRRADIDPSSGGGRRLALRNEPY